ncbi:NAD kinase [Corticibacter populi]|uniref:NAD kinase n=1 Tax=Corticibacter populi TaxID=1550736 RepID=A0A3M6QYL0_9BURK|nr:NAD kinase [Corticibacter populi]RMX08105.1 NAD kinase [Corticibacter populi]RZS35355.1 NAD+ kinase [Corticibacter populi]
MRSQFHSIAIIGKYQITPSIDARKAARSVVEDVARFLLRHDCEVVVEQDTARNLEVDGYTEMAPEAIGLHCDLCIAIGGDGTMLGIARQLAPYGTPLIGINQGRLGFVTDLPLNHYQDQLAPMLHGIYEVDSRPLIHARVLRDGECIYETHAINDVVLTRGGISGMIEMRIEVSGQFVSNQRADGLIIASPTGSTAYSMSAGGPIVHPATSGWVVTPIAPHKLSNRPLVLPDSCEVAVEVVAGRDMSASFDMLSLPSVLIGDRLLVRRSAYSARFLHPKGWNYYAMLRNKLGWNEGGS